MSLNQISNILNSLGLTSNGVKSAKKPASELKHSSKSASSFSFLSLVNQWKEIVGPQLYQKTRPIKINRGTLVVATNHPAYTHQLKFLESTVKKKIFERFPILRSHIRNIRYQYQASDLKPIGDDPSLTHSDKSEGGAQKKSSSSPLPPETSIKSLLHPQNPRYRQLQHHALQRYQHIEDDEIRNVMVELFVKNFIEKDLDLND